VDVHERETPRNMRGVSTSPSMAGEARLPERPLGGSPTG
jgi:hypothetical protein